MATRLGVDLGTTWTAAALNAGRPEVLQLGTHSLAMPSVVALDGESFVVGEAAERRLASDPSGGVREIKRRLGDTTPMVVGGRPYGPEALLAPLLSDVIARSAAQLGGAPDAVTLTHPANWGEYKLDLLREIARLANQEPVDLLPEPAAAALHYAQLGRIQPGDTVAVYDFGGGTFDVAVVRCGESSSEVIGTPGGLERLGGVDLDQIVLAHVNTALDGKLAELDSSQPETRAAIGEIRRACTAAKEALSTDSDAAIPIALGDLRTEVRLTRSEFEAAVRPRIEDTLGALDRALASAGVAVGDLAGVLLVGGSSRIPVVAEMVGAHSGRPLLVDADAKAVVPLGAAGPDAEASVAVAAGAGAAPGGGGGGRAGASKPSGREGAKSRSRSERGAGIIGTVAGVAAAGGVVAAGVAGYQALTDDDGGESDSGAEVDAPPPVGDDMDAFEDVVGGQTGSGSGFSDSPAGRTASRMFASASAQPSAATPAATVHQSTPGAVFSDPAIEAIRAQLRERLENLATPEGADPADVADLKADLEGLLDHYAAYPGQSPEDAIATLRYQFEDRVHDFAQDQKLDALLDDYERDRAAETALDREVGEMRDQLEDRLENWTPPAGADPTEAAALKSELAAMLERFTPIPGQSAQDAMADLKERFNDRVRDFAQDQKLDAVIDELSIPDVPQESDDDQAPTTDSGEAADTSDATEPTESSETADPTDPSEAPAMDPTADTPDLRVTTTSAVLSDVFEEVTTQAETLAADAEPEMGMIVDPVRAPDPVQASAAVEDALVDPVLGDSIPVATYEVDSPLSDAVASPVAPGDESFATRDESVAEGMDLGDPIPGLSDFEDLTADADLAAPLLEIADAGSVEDAGLPELDERIEDARLDDVDDPIA